MEPHFALISYTSERFWVIWEGFSFWQTRIPEVGCGCWQRLPSLVPCSLGAFGRWKKPFWLMTQSVNQVLFLPHRDKGMEEGRHLHPSLSIWDIAALQKLLILCNMTRQLCIEEQGCRKLCIDWLLFFFSSLRHHRFGSRESTREGRESRCWKKDVPKDHPWA